MLTLVVTSALTSADVSLTSGTRSPDKIDGAAGSTTHSIFVRFTWNFGISDKRIETIDHTKFSQREYGVSRCIGSTRASQTREALSHLAPHLSILHVTCSHWKLKQQGNLSSTRPVDLFVDFVPHDLIFFVGLFEELQHISSTRSVTESQSGTHSVTSRQTLV